VTLVLAFALTLLVAVLISGIAHRTVLSTTVLFLVAGFVLGQGMTGVLQLEPGDSVVSTLAEVALFTVLFTDGQRISIRDLRSAYRLPGRALLLGMPLTFGISSVLGVWLVGLTWPEAFLVAAVLAPTDPVFASAIVGRKEIPRRLRSLLSVESGLNDGLALPVVLILIAAVGGKRADLVTLGFELGLGIFIGIAVPILIRLLFAIPGLNATPLYAALTPVVVGLVIYGLVGVTHANPYLAAFAAGITLASIAPEARDAFREFADLISEVTKLLAILIFGALITPAVLADVPFGGYLFAVLLLVVARPAAVEFSLLGSELRWSERLTASWFGPKGFASVLYGLLVLDSGAEGAPQMFHLIVIAITVSIIAHSSTDVPIAAAFARAESRRH
jgi:NhaP-type Na+/H+ or K+/H+ antiporter